MTFGAEFLMCPAAAVVGGERVPWGGHAAVVLTPAGTVRLDGLSCRQLDGLQAHLGSFLAAPGEADVRFEVCRPPRPLFRPWQAGPREFRLELDFGRHEVLVVGLNLLLLIRLPNPPTAVLWTEWEREGRFPETLENALRVVTAYRLLEMGGCLLHGAVAVGGDDRARVFVGRSGAGKTTLSLLAREEGHEVLSDDLAAVVPVGKGYEVVAAPFAGELRLLGRAGARFPLAGVSQLAKGTRHRWDPVGLPAAVAALVTSAPFVNIDGFRATRLLEVVSNLAARVPVGQLTFAPRVGFWGVLDDSG